MRARRGAVVVDVQGDFTLWKGGSLAVSDSDEGYVRIVEDATRRLTENGFPAFATQDWHPADHVSFAINHPGKKPFDTIMINNRTQVLWPPHCVQGTKNAEVLIDNGLFRSIVQKGQNPDFDSYSGFRDDGGADTGLHDILRGARIEGLIIYGIATDYCVKATALDAVLYGYEVTVVTGLCRGVAFETSIQALDEMKSRGAIIIERLESL
jgi:nicotinamidase/pyrazinamidase